MKKHLRFYPFLLIAPVLCIGHPLHDTPPQEDNGILWNYHSSEDQQYRQLSWLAHPGILYGVEASEELSDDPDDWNTVGQVYGLGSPVTWSVLQMPEPGTTNGGGGDSEDFPANSASLILRTPIDGGIHLSWPSVENGQAVNYHLTGATLDEAWDLRPMNGFSTEDWHLFMAYSGPTDLPLPPNSTLTGLDSQLLNFFVTQLPAINQQVADSSSQPRSPAPPAGEKNFFRIKVLNYALDSDGDGLTDHEEFTDYGSSAFNSDTDGDGVSDADEVATGTNPSGSAAPSELEFVYIKQGGSIAGRIEVEREIGKRGTYVWLPVQDIGLGTEDQVDIRAIVRGRFVVMRYTNSDGEFVQGIYYPGENGPEGKTFDFEDGSIDAHENGIVVAPDGGDIAIYEIADTPGMSHGELWTAAKNSVTKITEVQDALDLAQQSLDVGVEDGTAEAEQITDQHLEPAFIAVDGTPWGWVTLEFTYSHGGTTKNWSSRIPIKINLGEMTAEAASGENGVWDDSDWLEAYAEREDGQFVDIDEDAHWTLLKAQRDHIFTDRALKSATAVRSQGPDNEIRWTVNGNAMKRHFYHDHDAVIATVISEESEDSDDDGEGDGDGGQPGFNVVALGIPIWLEDRELETGIDTWERFYESDVLERPTVLADHASGGAEFKLRYKPENASYFVGGVPRATLGKTVSATPNRTSASGDVLQYDVGGSLEPNERAYWIDGTMNLDKAYDLRAYERRDLNVAIHAITLITADGENIEPQNVPTKEEFEDYFDAVFGAQGNIWLNLGDIQFAAAAFDVGGLPENLAGDMTHHTGFPEAANGMYDVFLQGELSPEEEIVHQASKDEDASLNIYLLPVPFIAYQVYLPANGDPPVPQVLGEALGRGLTSKRTPVFACDGVAKLPILHSVCHEIAHNSLFGEAGLRHPRNKNTLHPDQYEGGFPLKDLLDDQKRLMWGTVFGWSNQGGAGNNVVRINDKTERIWSVIITPEFDLLHGASNKQVSDEVNPNLGQ